VTLDGEWITFVPSPTRCTDIEGASHAAAPPSATSPRTALSIGGRTTATCLIAAHGEAKPAAYTNQPIGEAYNMEIVNRASWHGAQETSWTTSVRGPTTRISCPAARGKGSQRAQRARLNG
jgi:hypothetical protein